MSGEGSEVRFHYTSSPQRAMEGLGMIEEGVLRQSRADG
jgi:hypothetical protein